MSHQTTSDPDEFRHKMEVLQEHCADVDRKFDEIERWAGVDVRSPSSKERVAEASLIADRVGAMAEVGAQCLTLTLPGTGELKTIEQFGRDVIPQVRDLEPAAVG